LIRIGWKVTQLFSAYIGIDYSGAGVTTKRLPGLQVFRASQKSEPEKITIDAGQRLNWNRKEIAHWCLRELKSETPVIIGIDHAFSFPLSYMERWEIKCWDDFLDDFYKHWPTDKDDVSVESLRKGNKRTGRSDELRITDNWTPSAKSVFQFDINGAVAKSSHSGIPWLRFLRRHADLKGRVHFWPFDGWVIPSQKSVIAEVYPAILKRRFNSPYEKHEHDAFCIAKWLQTMDTSGFLQRYFGPPLSDTEKRTAKLEGWILGVY